MVSYNRSSGWRRRVRAVRHVRRWLEAQRNYIPPSLNDNVLGLPPSPLLRAFRLQHRLTWPVLALFHHRPPLNIYPSPLTPLISHFFDPILIIYLSVFLSGLKDYIFWAHTSQRRGGVVAGVMELSRCKEMSGAKLRRRRRRGRSVRRKVKKLQMLIPGGRGLQPDRLFLRTADYILHLRLQVNVLQGLSKIYTP